MNVFIEQEKGRQVKSDLFVFGFFEENDVPGGCFLEVDQELDGMLTQMVQNKQISATYKEIQSIQTWGKLPAQKIALIGLGKQAELTFERAREIFGFVIKEANRHKAMTVSFCFGSFLGQQSEPKEMAHALAEASVLASYSLTHYKTYTRSIEEAVERVSICLMADDKDKEIETALQVGQTYGEATCLARDLVNMPGNLLTPSILAEKAVQIALENGFEHTILDRKEMEKKGMGALLAVAQGGEEPPKMIVLKYQGTDQWENVLGFVGKGLTFDSGGISLKPAQKLDEMKMDMGGSATVLGAMQIIGRLRPACNVLAVIPATENMPGGQALKPGDVITSYSGKTIEVKNTDAEGRLILADGITYAKELGADYIVDVATLTGAVEVALGNCTTGAITNDENFMIDLLESAQEAGELLWRLPDFEPYKKMVKSSEVADLNNAPGRPAGCITAGLFLGEFAEDTPWVHLDIAGTAWTDQKDELTAKGGTGVMVRTLAKLAETF